MLDLDNLLSVLDKPEEATKDLILVKSLITTPDTIILNILGSNIIFKKSQPGYDFVATIAHKLAKEDHKTITRDEYHHIQRLQNISQYIINWSEDRLQRINNGLYFRGNPLNKAEETLLVSYITTSKNPSIEPWLSFMTQCQHFKETTKLDLAYLAVDAGLQLNSECMLEGYAFIEKNYRFMVGNSYTLNPRSIRVVSNFERSSNNDFQDIKVGFNPEDISTMQVSHIAPLRSLNITRCKILEIL